MRTMNENWPGELGHALTAVVADRGLDSPRDSAVLSSDQRESKSGAFSHTAFSLEVACDLVFGGACEHRWGISIIEMNMPGL